MVLVLILVRGCLCIVLSLRGEARTGNGILCTWDAQPIAAVPHVGCPCLCH